MKQKQPEIIILCGGLGTRIKTISRELPKSMIKIHGKPFIQYQLELLKRNNFNNIILCVAQGSNIIEDFVGDGKIFGLNVKYSYDGNILLGTGGAIKNSLNNVNEYFFVMYGDSYLDINYKEVHDYYLLNDKKSVLTIFENNNLFDRSNIIFKNNKILKYCKNSNDKEMTYIDYGLSILNKKDFINFVNEDSFDLSNLYDTLVKERKLNGFEITERFYEIGSIEGFNDFSKFME